MARLSGPSVQDILASWVVFIIAIPLSLGIALASGADPAAGLVTAIVGGVLAGVLAGAPLVVTGPAAGLTAIVFQLWQQYGTTGLAVITLICGAFQLIFGIAKLAKYIALIPKAVLEGVLTAIGITIVLGQLHVLAGSKIPGSVFQSVVTLPEVYGGAIGLSNAWIAPVLVCGLIAILIQIFWSRDFNRLKWIPAALPAVLITTIASLYWQMPRVEVAEILPEMRNAVHEMFSAATLGLFTQNLVGYLFAGFSLAIVASAESLLTATAIDTIVEKGPKYQPIKLDRELIAQGTANLVSGSVGGLPMTAVMVRSAANLNAGAQTRWSAILHGVWIALVLLLIPGILTYIPLTALAAVLIITGSRLLNLSGLRDAMRHHAQEAGIWVFTTGSILATDLLKGLILGLVGAFVLKLWNDNRARAAATKSGTKEIDGELGFK